jgi:hypothetical protein
LNTRTNLVVSPTLADAAARRAPGLPDGAGLSALARYALARLAGWPHSAALDAARAPQRDEDGQQ